ncbi:hypothetical protein [Streptomyces sp. NPDC021212]|uniref:hypothetical protein n=1 Tax=Streptomyces sp. NPDC021212 TaxID=3365118 RepID=UPI0037BD98FF
MLEEHQRIQLPTEGGVDVEEVCRDDALGLRGQELAPEADACEHGRHRGQERDRSLVAVADVLVGPASALDAEHDDRERNAVAEEGGQHLPAGW